MIHSRSILFFMCGLVAATACAVIALEVLWSSVYLAPDSFTYFTMAKQWYSSGLLYSYTGIDHTTGIHPGYYFMLLPFFALAGSALPQVSFIINGLLLLAGCGMLVRVVGWYGAAAAVFLILTPYGLAITNNGMESSLLFFALCALAFFYSSIRVPWSLQSTSGLFLVGMSLALVVWARMDTAFLVFFFSLGVVFCTVGDLYNKISFPKVIRCLFLVGSPIALSLVVICYLNFHFGGSLLPVSGGLKSSFPHVASDWWRMALSLKMFLLAGVVSTAYLFILWRKGGTRVFAAAICLGVWSLFLYNSFFASDLGVWYSAFPFFVLVYITGICVEVLAKYALQTFSHAPIYIALAVMCASSIVLYCNIESVYVSEPNWVLVHKSAAEFLDQYAPSQSAAAELKDGVFAFYSRMPVYNLPGLANNQEYINAQRTGVVYEYLTAHNISYIIGGTFGSGVQVPEARELFRNCKDPLYETGMVAVYLTTSCIKIEI